MLEEAADDADDANAVAHVLNPWAQAANTANDQVDLHPRLGRAIQRVDNLSVDERVHLADDARRSALAGVIRFSLDQLDEPRSHVQGRDHELPIQLLARVTRERIE